MSTKPQIELFLENESGTQQVAYPFVESDHVSLSNSMDIDTMIRQDVSMPTVAHEDLSFKVGVGDQDVSSAIVDSSVAEMTIKGKTYQNILPEPSTHVLTNNKEMFKVNEGLDPNAEIVDGVSKSAILKGNTLVNLTLNTDIVFSKSNNDSNDIYTVDPSTPKKINITQMSANSYWRYISKDINLSMLKPNTKYILFATKMNGIRNVQIATGAGGNRLNTKVENITNNYAIITTNDLSELSNSTGQFLYFGINDFTEFPQTISIEDIMLIEYQDGMEKWDIPYFTGMQSVKMPVLTTTGKNLFDGELELGDIGFNDGIQTQGDFAISKNFNVINGGVNVICNIESSVQGRIYYYDGNKNYISTTLVANLEKTPQNAKYFKLRFNKEFLNSNIMMVYDTSITPYEPYKSNILSTPEEVVLRSLPNGVKDTLNLMTGEYVQRIGETTLDGSSRNDLNYHNVVKENNNEYIKLIINNCAFYNKNKNGNCDKLPFYIEDQSNNALECVYPYIEDRHFYIKIKTSRIVGADSMPNLSGELKQGFLNWLSQNPITVQYELATPVIKTVDLSSSGNWEKVVLDGSESWVLHSDNGSSVEFRFPNGINNVHSSRAGFSDKLPVSTGGLYERIAIINGSTYITVESTKAKTVEQLQLWLSQNPITVWYQTATTLDSTQVKQPIFFKDGHIIQSSGTDNSLIPTLDYQAKTSNSYVMDLMKTNTKYTMKAKSASGTFTIDGTSYGAGTNGTFTTPSSMTNKFLVMNNKTNEEVMIIEGDATSKTIPYFKGIKSAFEGEDKIEVLSTNRNLWTGADNYANSGAKIILHNENECIFEHHSVNNGIKVKVEDYEYQTITMSYDFEILDGKALNVGGHNRHQTKAFYIDGVKVEEGYHNGHVATYQNNRVYHVDHVVHINLPMGQGAVAGEREHIGIEPNRYSADTPTYCKMRVTNFQIILGDTIKGYTPPKPNSTKIPLLSPLRSLPNGVCDELIVDRMKNKATLIQRVGYVILGQGDGWGAYDSLEDTMKVGRNVLPHVKSNGGGMSSLIPYDFNSVSQPNEGVYIYRHASSSEARVRLKLKRTGRHDAVGMQNWLRNNNVVTLYELETPIITEVDLEGFPYIYKDGHIFLNGDIAPVTEIKYSINQSHMIEASNQDIIRHQKEIDYLYKLIGEYVRVDYKNTLLSLNLELK